MTSLVQTQKTKTCRTIFGLNYRPTFNSSCKMCEKIAAVISWTMLRFSKKVITYDVEVGTVPVIVVAALTTYVTLMLL